MSAIISLSLLVVAKLLLFSALPHTLLFFSIRSFFPFYIFGNIQKSCVGMDAPVSVYLLYLYVSLSLYIAIAVLVGIDESKQKHIS